MNIDLNTGDENRLLDQATARGYPTVDAFVSELLANVASLSAEAAVFAPLSEEKAVRNEAILRRGEQDLAAGTVTDMRQALQRLGNKRGFRLGASNDERPDARPDEE